ncbi:MAG: AsmA family protein [Ghiorsea sp.]
MLKLVKIISVLLVFVFIALLAIPFFVNVNDYKPEIQSVVKDATGRHIDIGNIKLRLFPWVGVTLSDIKLENASGFKQSNMLEAQSIDVQVALMPLLDQQVEVKRFELDSPKIWLAQLKDGTNNWSDLQQNNADTDNTGSTNTTRQPSAHQPQKNTPLPMAFEAKLLQLKHGQIIWDDERKGQLVVQEIQLKVTDLQLNRPIGIDFSAQVGSSPIHIDAKVGPLLDLSKLDAKTLPALINIKSDKFSLKPLAAWLPALEAEQESQLGKLEDIDIGLNMSIEQHSGKMILSSGDLKIQAKNKLTTSWKLNVKSLNTLKLEKFNLGIDDTDVFSATGKIRSLQKQPKFEVKVATNQLQRIWLNKLLPSLQDIYKEHPSPWKKIKMEAFLAGDSEIIEIRNMQLALDDEPVQISGDIAIGDAPDIQLRMTAGDLHLDSWIPQGNKKETPSTPTAAPQTGVTQAAAPEVEPDLTFLKSWYLSVQLQAKTIHAMKLTLENLRMTLSSEKGVVRLNPLSFETNGGYIKESLTLYANQYPATWKESIHVKSVSIHPILKTIADFDKLSGITTLDADLSGKGLLYDNIIHSVTGRGNFLFEDGQFKGVDIAKEIRKFKKQPDKSENSDFAQMQGSFHIRNATLTNNDLYMASPLFRLSGKGSLYLDPPSIDYHVRPRLVKSLTGQGGSVGKKGVVIPLHISGPFNQINVDVELDKNALLDSAAALNQAAGGKIGGVGGKILDNGFVKTRDEQAAKAKAEAKRKAGAKIQAEKARAEAALKQQAKDKLKNILKGFKF